MKIGRPAVRWTLEPLRLVQGQLADVDSVLLEDCGSIFQKRPELRSRRETYVKMKSLITASLSARIAELEERLQQLLGEPHVMDDEVNAVERDLQALQRKLADAQ